MKSYPYVQINCVEALPEPEENTGLVGHYAFQYIDFTEPKAQQYALNHTFVDCCFFGCELLPQQYRLLQDCLVLPRMGQAYHAFVPDLYNAQTLYEGFTTEDTTSFKRCFDHRVYKEYRAQGEMCDDIRIMLARTLHDHTIYDELMNFLHSYDPKNVVGIMGGHGLKRKDEGYRKIALISKRLTEKGKLMISGGGPGAMEATHLGAWMAGRHTAELDDALSMLIEAGEEDTSLWVKSAFEVIAKYPQDQYKSLSIPTWFYGHEPSTPFATHIAKFFTNSVREDMILSIAQGALIISPGSAGTLQEIFQNAAKLHYDEDGEVGPMIFLDSKFYTEEIPVYPFMKDLCDRGKYRQINLFLTDDPEEVCEIVNNRS